jgi:hypothetical protein
MIAFARHSGQPFALLRPFDETSSQPRIDTGN